MAVAGIAVTIALVVILLFNIILWTMQFFNTRRRLENIAKHFNCPPRVKILRHIEVLKNKSPIKALLFGYDSFEAFETLMSYTYTHGPNFVAWGFLNHIDIIVSDPQDLEVIFNSKNTKKSHHYDFLLPWLGTGLITSSGQKWHQRRKLITPSFHFKILERFVEVFNEQALIMIKNLDKKIEQGCDEIDLYTVVTSCAIDIISESAMGVKVNAQSNNDTEYCRAVKEMGEIVFKNIFSIFNQFPKLYALTPRAKHEKQVIKILHEFTNSVISRRQKELMENNYNYLEKKGEKDADDTNIYGSKHRLSFLDMLLQLKNNNEQLSYNDLREEVDTFMFAGHDTSTSTMTFTCYELAMNPEVQEKVYQEICEVFGKGPLTTCSYQDLQKLKYLEMVLKETMRLHPTIPTIGRQAVETIKIQGVDLPPGIDFTIPIYAIHLNPKIYPEPQKFDPERFTDAEAALRGPYDYIPFSAGSRNCMGQKFAMLEMKSLISYIVKNFRLLPTERCKNLKSRVDVVLRPVDGMFLKVERRK